MVLPRCPKRRIRGKASPGVIHWVGKEEPLPSKLAQQLLPRLYSFTKGAGFNSQTFRVWLARLHPGTTAAEANAMLAKLSRSRPEDPRPSPTAWLPSGVRFADPEGEANAQNLEGFEWQQLEKSKAMSWNEYGYVYRLQVKDANRSTYVVARSKNLKKASAMVSKRTLELDKKAIFRSCVVMDMPLSRWHTEPQWSLIYLHSFSAKGTDYLDFPHYFNVCGASMRVVVPTAPLLEQQCFKDWWVWRGENLKWRRIKFNAWFDYVTDKGGVAENSICEQSLLAIREKLHKLIRHEVQRVGDPKRVIVGGASQGCCAALDAALTFEQELGGVVGLVGHLLRSTPLDASKKRMPMHLFHEESDKEMRWKWVQGTMQRLTEAGFNVSSKRERDPAGCGHWIQDIEGRWVRSALRQIMFSQSQ
eukprot:CAMPEP_0181438074 /NCGR_PEP_ID=MMETSP1110-20121109/21716_1 /TAXON_ID=174948 /ORGANISM="Symbiodinium sp., Strain CCMP421" /LENGTH=417 /DNA_ID=CAMNT_0023561739 /DNA_START=29 /DNA_END=1282 /DNA_ORIENTATION=-